MCLYSGMQAPKNPKRRSSDVLSATEPSRNVPARMLKMGTRWMYLCILRLALALAAGDGEGGLCPPGAPSTVQCSAKPDCTPNSIASQGCICGCACCTQGQGCDLVNSDCVGPTSATAPPPDDVLPTTPTAPATTNETAVSCDEIESQCAVKACDVADSEARGCGTCSQLALMGETCWSNLDLECSQLSSRGCAVPLTCDSPWVIDGSSKDYTSTTKVCCPEPSCPAISTSCPSYIRSVDAHGCVTECSCVVPDSTLPIFTVGPTVADPVTTPYTRRSSTTADTTTAPALAASNRSTAKFDTGIWVAITVLLVIFILVGVYAKYIRTQQRAGQYDLNPPVLVGMGVGGDAPGQARKNRRDLYAMESPPIALVPQSNGAPVQETDIDAHRQFAANRAAAPRTLVLKSSRVGENEELMNFGTTADAAAKQAALARFHGASPAGDYGDEDGDQVQAAEERS